MVKFTESLVLIQSNRSQKEIVLREEANACSYLSPDMMAELVAALAPPHAPVSVLVFCGYALPAATLQILSAYLRTATLLESLDMAFCALTSDDVSILLDGILGVDRIAMRVNLGYNKLDITAGHRIATELSKNPGRISQLCVRSNALTTKGVVPLLDHANGLTSLDVAFTDMKAPYDDVFRVLAENSTLVHLKLVGASFTDEDRFHLDRATIHNSKSRLQERSQVPMLDSRTSTSTNQPRRMPLIDFTNATTPQVPDEEVTLKLSSSPVAHSVVTMVHTRAHSPQPHFDNTTESKSITPEVAAMRQELALLRQANVAQTQENGALRTEMASVRHLLEVCLKTMQEGQTIQAMKEKTTAPQPTTPAFQRRSSTPPAPQTKRAAAASATMLNTSRGIINTTAVSERPGSRSPSGRRSVSGNRRSIPATQPAISSRRSDNASPAFRREPTPTAMRRTPALAPSVTATSTTSTARPVGTRPSLSQLNANVTQQMKKTEPSKPSNRLCTVTAIRPSSSNAINASAMCQPIRLHLAPFAGH